MPRCSLDLCMQAKSQYDRPVPSETGGIHRDACLNMPKHPWTILNILFDLFVTLPSHCIHQEPKAVSLRQYLREIHQYGAYAGSIACWLPLLYITLGVWMEESQQQDHYWNIHALRPARGWKGWWVACSVEDTTSLPFRNWIVPTLCIMPGGGVPADTSLHADADDAISIRQRVSLRPRALTAQQHMKTKTDSTKTDWLLLAFSLITSSLWHEGNKSRKHASRTTNSRTTISLNAFESYFFLWTCRFLEDSALTGKGCFASLTLFFLDQIPDHLSASSRGPFEGGKTFGFSLNTSWSTGWRQIW